MKRGFVGLFIVTLLLSFGFHSVHAELPVSFDTPDGELGSFQGILFLIGSCHDAQRSAGKITIEGKSLLIGGFAYYEEEETWAFLGPEIGPFHGTIHTSSFIGYISSKFICGFILGSWEEYHFYG